MNPSSLPYIQRAVLEFIEDLLQDLLTVVFNCMTDLVAEVEWIGVKSYHVRGQNVLFMLMVCYMLSDTKTQFFLYRSCQFHASEWFGFMF